MKKWLKRLVSLVLCLVMLAGTCTLDLRAETNGSIPSDWDDLPDVDISQLEKTSAPSAGMPRVGINPLYKDWVTQEELAAYESDVRETMQPQMAADKSLEYCDSYGEALYSAAQQMRDRKETCYIMFRDTGDFWYYNCYNKTTEELFDATDSAMQDCMQHTGDPKLGDSLRWQYRYCSVWTAVWEWSGDYCYYTLMFAPEYHTTAAQESALDTAVEALLDELDVYSGTEYDKVEAVYDWICANVVYDYDHMNLTTAPVRGQDKEFLLAHSAYGALMLKKSVCQGYALLMYRLLLELGVDNRIVTGSNHAWNIVDMGTYQYYYCDATWDAGVKDYRYFLVGETDDFYVQYGHVRDAEYDTAAFWDAYPMAWAAYTPGQEHIKVVPTGLSLSTKSLVKYNLYYDILNMPKDAELYSTGIYVYDHDPATAATFDPLETQWATYTGQGSTYVAQTSGCAAKQMGDLRWFEPYVMLADGSMYYDRVVTSSVANYAQKILQGDYSDEMKSLAVAMLNYGAAAQTYFDYRADALVNRSLKEDQAVLADAFREDMLVEDVIPDTTKTVEFALSADGSGDCALSVSLDDALAINYYYMPTYTPDEGSVKLYFWSYDTFWGEDMTTADNADIVLDMVDIGDGWYMESVTGMAARQIDDTMYVSMTYTSGGKAYCSGTVPHSINSYCADLIERADTDAERELAEAIVVYGYYADAYFDR